MKIEINATGKKITDLEKALTEILIEIEGGITSGQQGSDDRSYCFEIDEDFEHE